MAYPERRTIEHRTQTVDVSLAQLRTLEAQLDTTRRIARSTAGEKIRMALMGTAAQVEDKTEIGFITKQTDLETTALVFSPKDGTLTERIVVTHHPFLTNPGDVTEGYSLYLIDPYIRYSMEVGDINAADFYINNGKDINAVLQARRKQQAKP